MHALIITNYDKDFSKALEADLVNALKNNNISYEVFDYQQIIHLNNKNGQECIMFIIGGDGTLLGSLRYSADLEIPAIGINSGRKGFLIEIGKDEILSSIDLIINKKYIIKERTIISADIYSDDRSKVKSDIVAINDLTVSRYGYARIIGLDLKIDSGYEDSFAADGVLVSTPTGSTAYSLSAGGPIVMPEVNCLIITPICAHSLHTRPVIVPDNVKIRISVKDEDVILTSDGQTYCAIPSGGYVDIYKYKKTARLISLDYDGYYKRFKQKMLNWAKS